MRSNDEDVEELAERVHELLTHHSEALPFHSWSHTEFVRSKAVQFATERDANVRLVEAAALVHDLNYLVEANSGPGAGTALRCGLLAECGFGPDEIDAIESMVEGAHTEWRGPDVDVETACLSDADTLYKALPITPVLFSDRYLNENRMGLFELARKIVNEQSPKVDAEYYFYDPELTERYGEWVEANLQLWKTLLKSLGDPDVAQLVEEAQGRPRGRPFEAGGLAPRRRDRDSWPVPLQSQAARRGLH